MKHFKHEKVRFFIVGFSAFLVDFVLLNILVYGLNFTTQLFDFVLIANIISTFLAIMVGFLFQRKWTFKKESSIKVKNQFSLFLSLQLFNIMIYNTILFNTLVNNARIKIPISKIIVVSLQMITSYLIMKYYIFKESSNESVELA